MFDDENVVQNNTSIREELREMMRRRGGLETVVERPIEEIITATKSIGLGYV
jgi:hypothetical protein